MNTLRIVFLPLLFSVVNVSLASEDTKNVVEFESPSLNINLTNSGAGIVKDVWCRSCDFKTVKITPETKVYAQGNEVSISEAGLRRGKPALVVFNSSTRKVHSIRW